MTQPADIRVFATHPHACSYLPARRATTLFVDPATRMDRALYSELAELGFRRSGPHVYRPHCSPCRACLPARVIVPEFRRNRSQRRIWRANQDLDIAAVPDIQDPEYYRLYARYIIERHSDGDMFPPSRDQYESFLTAEWGLTHYYRFSQADRLLAVAVVDRMDNGLSAIYTFFEPSAAARSLGTFAILWQIELAKRLGLPALYLGYWIGDCRKMNYKLQFRPAELLIDGQWSRI